MLYTFEKSNVAATDSKKNKRKRNSLKRQKNAHHWCLLVKRQILELILLIQQKILWKNGCKTMASMLYFLGSTPIFSKKTVIGTYELSRNAVLKLQCPAGKYWA